MENWRKNKKKYAAQYAKENLKRVPLDMQIRDYEAMKEHVLKLGETVNGFIKRAIKETMDRDNNSIS